MNWHIAIKVTVALALLAVLIVLPSPVRASPDIVTLRPDGAGDETYLTPNTGTNYAAVDDTESGSDGDTTYVWSNSAGYVGDLYTLENTTLAGKGTINSVTVYVRCRVDGTKSGAGARTRIKTNGAVHYGADINLTGSYPDPAPSTAYTTNPETGSQWTWAEVNALQAGVDLKKVKGQTSRCTQVWVEVDYMPSTWNSYSDALHETPCETFENSTNHVYMKGESFASGTLKVGYYDADGVWAYEEIYIDFGGGTLTSECDLYQDWGGSPPAGDGTWHAVVIQQADSLPSTYDTAIVDPEYIVDDDFYVANSAIPEFPTIIAAIIVAGLCFGIYYWMRKRRLAYVPA